MGTRGLEALTVEDLVEDAYETAKDKGWWDEPAEKVNLGEKIALIHSEASEALEDIRNGLPPETVYFLNKTTGERSPVPRPGYDKPVGFPIELADIVIRVADLCGHLGIDLEYVLRIKMSYNETRPKMHGGKKF